MWGLITTITAVIAGSLVSCTSTPAAPAVTQPSQEATKTLTLKWVTFEPDSSLATQQLKMTAQLAEKYSGGTLKWEFYPAEQLVKGPDEYEAIRDGTADAGYVSVPYESDTFKLSTIIELPFTLRDFNTELYTWRELMRAGLDEYYQSFGVKPVAMSYTEAMEVWSTAKWGPIDSLEKAKGAKLRSPGGGVAKAFATLGFTPVSMASPETYSALERGTLDASSMAAEIMVSYKLPEVAKYALRTGFVHTGMPACVNLALWKRLAPQQQLAIIIAGQEAEEWRYRSSMLAEDKIIQPALKAARVQQIWLTPQEEQRWKDRLAPLWDEWLTAYGNESNGLGRKIMKAFKDSMGLP